MELQQLQSFVTVAEQLHFGRAAQILHISQPSLSQRIRRLEDELGVELLARSSRDVRLTEPGRRLVTGAKRLLDDARGLRESVKNVGEGLSGRLTVGAVPSIINSLVPGALAQLRSTAPELEVVVKPLSSRAQMGALLRGSIDVGIARGTLTEPGLRSVKIFEEPVGAIIRRNHEPSESPYLPVDDIDPRVPLCIIGRAVNPRLYDDWMTVLERSSFNPRSVIEMADIHCVLAFVVAGAGISIQPRSLLELGQGKLMFAEIPGGSSSPGAVQVIYAGARRPDALGHFLAAARHGAEDHAKRWQSARTAISA